MKKFLIITLILFVVNLPAYSWHKKEKPTLILSSYDPRQLSYDEKIEPVSIFKTNERIYFMIYNPEGFKSDYIKYQIIKQEDNAHVGGFTRERNVTCRLNNKNQYIDYFVLPRKGKYFIQIFDITNLNQWLTIGAFRVTDE